MSQNVVLSGVTYEIPDTGDTPPTEDWGAQLTAYLVALATAYGNTAPGFLNIQSVTSTPVTTVSGKTYMVATSAPRQLNLPVPAVNAYILIKDVSGLAETNNITIHRYASETIDGVAADKTLSINNELCIIVSDGTNWFVLLEI